MELALSVLGGLGFESRRYFLFYLFIFLLIKLYYFTWNANRAVARVCQHQLSLLGATRSIERISYGNVPGWVGGCRSQAVLYQND